MNFTAPTFDLDLIPEDGRFFVDPEFTLPNNDAVNAAVKSLSDARLYTAAREERFDYVLERFNAAIGELDDALGFEREKPLAAFHVGPWGGNSDMSTLERDEANVLGHDTIALTGRMSVVTFLHLYARSIGLDPYAAAWFSLNLFKVYWPNSFGRLVWVPGTYMVRAIPRGIDANDAA